MAVLGRLPGTTVYRNVTRFAEVERFAGVLIVRIDAPMYFGNIGYLKKQLAELDAKNPTPVTTLIIDASGISSVDTSADAVLYEVADCYERRGGALLIAGAIGPVRDALSTSGFAARLGRECFYRTVDEAVRAQLPG
jgi:SulP family sulfate permease